MELLVTSARLALAGIFVVSAVAKLRDRDGSRSAVEAFGVPGRLVAAVTIALPLVELVCAALLVLPDRWAAVGGVLSMLVLAAFTVAIIVNLLQGNSFVCHCFGDLGGNGTIGWSTVLRNVGLMGLAAVTLLGFGDRADVVTEVRDLGDGTAVMYTLLVLLAVAVVVLASVVHTLVGKYGDVLLRLHDIEVLAGVADPDPAPSFTLPDLSGTHFSLDELMGPDEAVLLTFISPSCHNCTELLPDLVTWQQDQTHPLRTVVISDGDPAANGAKLAGVGGHLKVLLQTRTDVADDYGVMGTPAAVLVGADRRMAGRPVHGADAIRELRSRTITAMSGPVDGAHRGHAHGGQALQIDARPTSAGDAIPPDAGLVDAEGARHDASSVLDGDKVVLFWSTTCGFCSSIVEDVRALATDHVIVVSPSPAEAVRAAGLHAPVFRDAGLEPWLQVPGTPSAARFRDGRLASDVAVGGPQVLALLAGDPEPFK